MLYLFFLITFFAQTVLSANTTPIMLYQGLSNQTEMCVDLNQTEKTNFSIHFLLTTIGRKTIFRMLDSLKNQFKAQDYLTIVFDGKDIDNVYSDVQQITQNFACTVNIFFEPENLGFWGHGIRNKYAPLLQGDFVMHCDDDDIYLPNTISIVRKVCIDKTKLYFFRFKHKKTIIWREPKIYYTNIGTPCGVIPNCYNNLAHWALYHGGDAAFYTELSNNIPEENILFVDFVIYKVY